MFRLDNPVQPYAWGSATAIPSLLRRAPTAEPQAELWLGAHPAAPSRLEGGGTLEAHIAAHPLDSLGAAVQERFGPRLPFLLKVLAAAKPLSLQAHPSLEQARAGFAREEQLGVPRSAPHRNYKDANHKPELICALTRFDALCGFRSHLESVRWFEALGLETSDLKQGLGGYFQRVMTLSASEKEQLANQVVRACRERAPKGFEAECAWAVRLGAAYPGDVGVVGALLLNLVTLEPLQALYLPAGNLHAYLEGVGIEVMANSDNVLRGGLTPKHVDVGELMHVLDFRNGPIAAQKPRGPVAVYQTPAPDFELSRIEVTSTPVVVERRGPDIVLVTEGEVHCSVAAGERLLAQGESVFVAANEGPVTLRGSGVAFRATVGVLG